jgi:hypothetical protein
MRRLSGVVLAGAMFMGPAFSQSAFAQEAAPQEAAPQQQAAAQPEPTKLTYNSAAVMIVYNINLGKDADYEQVLNQVKMALQKSSRPEARQQLQGWKVIKNSTPQADGTSVYIHMIDPVIRGADYSLTNIVYETATDEEKIEFYNLYKGALLKPMFQMEGPIANDFSR